MNEFINAINLVGEGTGKASTLTKLEEARLMEKFSSLTARLEKIESEHLGSVDTNITQKREGVMAALKHYQHSRFLLGKSLAEYKCVFTEDRGWMTAAQAIAKVMGCGERTVRNIIEDYKYAADLPDPVVKAAHSKGIDPAKRKHRATVAAIKSSIAELEDPESIDSKEAEQIISKVLVMPSLSQRRQIQDDAFIPLTRAEKERFKIRMKIRTGLTNIKKDQKLPELIKALEEEMFDAWGQVEPVTITITPHASGLTLDGRKRREDAA
jgi:hypothetical protein